MTLILRKETCALDLRAYFAVMDSSLALDKTCLTWNGYHLSDHFVLHTLVRSLMEYLSSIKATNHGHCI